MKKVINQVKLNNKKKKLVSVLIVTYNAQNFIQKTLKSCLNQTYSNFEILILDNNSSDDTVKIIKLIKDPRVKLFKSKQNIGPYNGLNFLLDKAKGKFIAIQDHDDLWFPLKLEKQIDFLNSHPTEIACGTKTYIFYENKNILISDKKPTRLRYVNHVSLVFRNQGYRYNPDFLLTDEHFEKIILHGNTKKIPCLQQNLTIHRIRGDRNNLSRTRYKFSYKNIKRYLLINGFKISTFINLFGIFVSKYFPKSFEWFIIDKIIKRNSQKIALKNFQKKYPNLI
jgi:glycosyltransferase involved in cell wall biosynthesis